MDAFFATERLPSYLLPFISLSYPTARPESPDSFPNSTYYTTGPKDLCIIVTCIAVMALLRDAFRLGVLEPVARWTLSRIMNNRKTLAVANGSKEGKFNGHSSGAMNGRVNSSSKKNTLYTNGHTQPSPSELRKMQRSVLRFAEQGWSFVYYTAQWSFGLYVHINLPTRILDPTAVWQGYPHISLAGPLKFYYLGQTAFYIHQVLILNAEARRKDHVQMMTHHVITLFLMATSYFTNFTRIGCLIMVLMDWCDIFLPLAKMIRYLEISQLACDITFAWFLVSWLVTRHFLFLFAIVSAIRDAPRYIPWKWSVEEGYFYNRTAYWFFATLLSALQVLQILWFWMICRIAWRVITTDTGASDDRSDDEGDEKEE